MKPSVKELFEQYRNNLYAAAFNVCGNAEDAEDVVQDTFIQYYLLKKEFDNEQHIRAWLIRVAIKYLESGELFETVMKLPRKYRIVIHLFYYEDYTVHEIADILRITESNVKVRLSRGRVMLKEKLREEWEDDE